MEASSRGPTAALLILVALGLSACGSGSTAGSERPTAKVVRIPGTDRKQIVLSPIGAERIGIRTGRVRSVLVRSVHGRRHAETVVPYSAIIYAPSGETFTYTSPARLRYVQRRIVVDRIIGNRVFLRSGPPAGTVIVTVGEPELLGILEGVVQET